MKANIIGCDQSLTKSVLHCGIHTKKWGNNDTSMHMAARLAAWEDACYDAICGVTTSGSKSVAYIEGYSFGSQAHSKETAGEIGGLLRVILYTRNIDTVVVVPTTLKKFICGKGNAPKDGVRMDLLKSFKIESKDNNDADARVLEIMGHCHQGAEHYNGIKFTKHHRDCVKVLNVWKAAV